MKLEVELGTVVTLHFALVLEDGDVIDSNFESRTGDFYSRRRQFTSGIRDHTHGAC